jgi:hypothetical protein
LLWWREGSIGFLRLCFLLWWLGCWLRDGYTIGILIGVCTFKSSILLSCLFRRLEMSFLEFYTLMSWGIQRKLDVYVLGKNRSQLSPASLGSLASSLRIINSLIRYIGWILFMQSMMILRTSFRPLKVPIAETVFP